MRTAAQFATTHWSVVVAAGDSASPKAQEALEALCRRYWYPLATSGREHTFEVLRPHLQGEDEDMSYAVSARKLATSEATVRVMVYRLRRRYREILNGVVLGTVDSPAEVEDELRHLLHVVQG